jgi:hypothetical protein
MWKVSDVMEVSIPSGVGYGFNVITEGRKPLVLFAYDEQEAAEAAAQQVAAAPRASRPRDAVLPMTSGGAGGEAEAEEDWGRRGK